ncbi:NADH:flavin oxidoreductase/NADH oxidase [Mycena sanguinolenta]|uniref:NADH:flavin oxidoreductase/NADH oxidase n=1 Tax=Mycena sanguinolenta TaxID=230812 RepID=A0A8H6XQD9_9AGAR|nr:NADH:flavin oxidoreductase/NADH oxidase [Mycena sanguinolenta]
MSTPKLFQATQVGDVELAHRVVFAPATRYRVDDTHTPVPLVAEYYEQRASTPGSLLITEATLIAQCAGGAKNTPGIWSEEQISAWKAVTDRVHAKGSFIFLQIWALGRAVQADVLEKENITAVSASDIPLPGGPKPRPLTVDEIKEYAELFAQGATNAVHKAGFDGVEIHGANGYLIDQFLHPGSNFRTDACGGSIENRVRFALEVTDAVVKAVGQKKTAFRISPWGTWQEMHFDDPMPTYAHLVTELRDRYPDLAYLHAVEPRSDGDGDASSTGVHHSNDFLRKIWGNKPFISAGGYTRASAIAVAEEKGDLIAFARPYIANPDLPYRLIHDIALTVGDRSRYYALGSVDPRGYTDYPFASPVVKAQA